MGCLSRRRKQTEVFADQKWDYINLRDFTAKGCGTSFAYGYLWFSLFLSVAVYAVDSFTAVNLLVFNRWSSQIEPGIPFKVSKWIFSICIILSFINLAYEGIRATRVIRRGNVAESYLDSLAVRWESIRMGSGQGWRRFLVFAELTKSKKGTEYIALFTYFSFQSWIRVILCSGPRQVINAFTLKSVYESKLTTSSDSVEGSIKGFFDKIEALAAHDYRQAVILSGMCFTLIVWVFSALFLLSAVLFYVLFLSHWIPRADGGLSGYCERKVTKALMKIVTTKVNNALARQEADRFKAEAKAAMKNGEKPRVGRQATLPTLPSISEDKLPGMPMLGRNETMATLPPYTSRPTTPGNIGLSPMDKPRPMPSRSGTNASFSSRVPLVGSAADMGYDRSASPVPSLPDFDGRRPRPQRSATFDSQQSYESRAPLGRMMSGSNSSLRGTFTESPGPIQTETMPPFPAPVRSPTSRTLDSYTEPMGPISYGPTSTHTPYQYNAYDADGHLSPASSMPMSRNGPDFPRQPVPMNPAVRSATGSYPSREPHFPPSRSMTAPMPPRAPPTNHFDRSLTSQSVRRSPISRDPNHPSATQDQRGQPYGYGMGSQSDGRYRY